MPTLMPKDTRDALGPNAEKCDSRSLLLDRFVYDHLDMDEARKLHFSQVCADSLGSIRKTRDGWEAERRDLQQKLQREQQPEARKRLEQAVAKLAGLLEDTKGLAQRTSAVGASVCVERGKPVFPKADSHSILVKVLPQAELLHAQLQSRLMVNMAGGVMENAGLCLDRFGLPYIPGSAVKGCARRAATYALLEVGTAEAKAEILFNLCLVFGWGDTDWKSGRKRKRERGLEVETEPYSDFWWAMTADTGDRTADDARRNQTWNQVGPIVASRLLDFLRVQKREHPKEPWLDLPNFAGSVSFLPAYPMDLGKTGTIPGLPLDVPPLGKLELDVVTCHHRDYYEGKLQTATDTEEPNPVVFPAVAPGHVFTFALVPLRGADQNLLKCACTWLKTGLETFGLGAKTNAGYGWFADVTKVVQPLIAAHQERLAKEAAKKAAAEKTAAEAAAQAAAEAERLAKAPPCEKFRAEYAKLRDEPFAAQAKKFAEMTDLQRHGFVLALKDRRETAKRWSKKKPELLKPWQEFAQKLQPPIQLP